SANAAQTIGSFIDRGLLMSFRHASLVVAPSLALCLLHSATACRADDADSSAPTVKWQPVHALTLEERPCSCSFSPAGKTFACNDGTSARVSDHRTWKQVRAFTDEKKQFIHSVRLSPDGRILAFASVTNTIHLLDVESGKVLRTLSGGQDVVALAFS